LKKAGEPKTPICLAEETVGFVGTVAIARSFTQPLQNDFLNALKNALFSV